MARKPVEYWPVPVAIGNLRSRPMRERGSHPDDAALPPEDRRYYWRVFRGDKPFATLQWVAPGSVAALVAERFTVTGDDSRPVSIRSGTVAELLAAYGAHVAADETAAARTKAQKKTAIKALTAGLGDLRLGQVTEDALEAYKNARLTAGPGVRRISDKGLSKGTVSVELVIFGTAWRWGMTRGLAPRAIPARPKMHRAKGDGRVRHTPTDADITLTLAALPVGSWPWLLLRIMDRTGMRVHEVAALRRDCLDHIDAYVRVPSPTKTGERDIPIRPDLVTDIRAMLATHDGDRVLPVAVTSCRQAAQIHFARASVAAGVRPFLAHGVRRAVVRRFRRAGVDVKVAAAIFGHSVAVMLTLYDEADETDHTKAMDLVAAFEQVQEAKEEAKAKRRPAGSVVTMRRAK